MIRIPAAKPVATLADLMKRITSLTSITPKQQRELFSAIASFCRFVGKAPEDIPVNVVDLRGLLNDLHPAPLGVSHKRLSNVKSSLGKALELTGAIDPSPLRGKLSLDWRRFLSHAERRHHAYTVMRFARLCSSRKIQPHKVSNAVFRDFCSCVDRCLLTKSSKDMGKDTVWAFNLIAAVAGVKASLSRPRTSAYVSTDLEAYPASLRADFDKYLSADSFDDLFATTGRRRALRPTSLRNNRNQLRQLLDAAVQGGFATSDFNTLADTIRVDVLKVAFPVIKARTGLEAPTSLFNIMCMVVSIARHHVRPAEEEFARLEAVKSNLADKLDANRPRMSEKNVRRLEQFDDGDEALRRLLALPEVLMDRALRNPDRYRDQLDAMRGVAIAILLACAPRMSTLTSLDIEKNLSRNVKGKSVEYSMYVRPEQVKNGKAMAVRFNKPTSSLIHAYLTKIRGRLSESPGNHLFPCRSAGGRPPGHFGEDIKAVIFRETGIVMHAHLFRHLSVKIVSEAFPEISGLAQRIVGHKKAETTEAFYAPIVEMKSFDRYADILSRKSEDV